MCYHEQPARPGPESKLNEPVREKTNNLGSDQVRHKWGCTVTEDGLSLEIFRPPTSEEVEGAYWFGSVRAVSLSVCDA